MADAAVFVGGDRDDLGGVVLGEQLAVDTGGVFCELPTLWASASLGLPADAAADRDRA